MSYIGIATNKKIKELVKMMTERTLILKPRFQRNLVWNDRHKEKFIETIINGYPFPEIYLADGEYIAEIKGSITYVVDGQQRLDTIYKYVSDSESMKLTNIKKFSELSLEQQENFLDYIVVVRDLGRINDELIIEIFNRINSVKYALNAIEINNALYEGDYINTAKEILELNILNDIPLFREDENARMKDLEFILIVMTTVEIGGYFARDNEVEDYIKMYDDNYPNKETAKGVIINSLNLLKTILLPSDSVWYRKSTFFSLLCELALYFKRHNSLPSSEKLTEKLIDLELSIAQNKNKGTEDNVYAMFYKYTYQGTSSRTGRNVRGDLIKHLLENI